MLPTITVIGNVKYMETKVLQSGKQVTSLVVSCSEKRKDGNWDNLNIKAEFWENSAKFVNDYFNDGDVIVVTGKLITNSYETNGQKRSEIKFHFPQASFLPKVQNNNSQGNNQQSNNSQANYQQPQQQAQPRQQPPVEYQNAQGQPVPPQQYQANQQQAQVPPAIDVNEDEIPF